MHYICSLFIDDIMNIRLIFRMWLLIILPLFLITSGCKKGPPDGNYCAKVQFVQPGTKKNASLTIIAEVKDNQVTQFSFPDGHFDVSPLKPVKIPQDGKFTAVSTQGTVYKVTMQGGAEKCLKAQNMVQCKGLSKDGNRCGRFTDNKNGLCWQHKGQKR